jgi:hypothetical protein
MAGFLFWNLYGRQRTGRERRAATICSSLTRLVCRHSIDVLVFAECVIQADGLAKALSAAGCGVYHLPPSRGDRLQIWTRLPAHNVIDRFNDRMLGGLTAREIGFPGADNVLLAAVHLRDRSTIAGEPGRALKATAVAAALRKVEADVGHARTILVGDFNMNPYEAGVVGTQALHAVMTRQLAVAAGRYTARKDYPCFYNPMWSCQGDGSPGPPGTYFYRNPEDPANPFWQLLDQVLIRPALLGSFNGVEILDGDGVESFVTDAGRPRVARYSDHLPLFFSLDLAPGARHADRNPRPLGR